MITYELFPAGRRRGIIHEMTDKSEKSQRSQLGSGVIHDLKESDESHEAFL